MKKVLIFVLSAQIPPWHTMIQQAMETWDSEPLEGTETIYYSGAPEKPHEERALYFPVEEDYKTMGYKDLLAYAWAMENREWDYMARAHSSCYVHKARLLEEVQTLPDTGVFRGIEIGPTITSGTGERNWLWGGCHFIMSRDVIAAMLRESKRWKHNIMEDAAMSELVQDCGFKLDGGGKSCSINKTPRGWNCITYGGNVPSFDFSDFAEVARLTDQYFFRVKCDADRAVDADVMRLLKQHLPA
jgi:hypothetical protein